MSGKPVYLAKKSGFWGPVEHVDIGSFFCTRVAASEIAELRLLQAETKMVKKGVGRGTGALAGGLLFGPAGIIAGALVTSKKNVPEATGKLSAVLRTKDGRGFAIECTAKQAQAIMAAIT